MKPLGQDEMSIEQGQGAQDALAQLAEARDRAEAELLGGRDAVLAEAIRRAEAILFAAGEALSAEQIALVLPQGIEAGEVLMALKAVYAKRGVNLAEVAGKWRFQTAPDLSWLFVEERPVQKKLGQAAMETLAIIAYGQPVTRAEIEAVRGVAVAKSVIDTLLETGWVKVRGRRKTPGLPITYGTTEKFLEHFGLESLDTLPGKAELESEGLLSDVIPPGLQMPDEEAFSEGGPMIDDAASVEEVDSFVTDFIAETLDETDPSSAQTVSASGAPSAPALPADDEDEGDRFSLAAYRRAPPPDPQSEEAFDDAAVKAAVRKLRSETRIPQQPMHAWRDDE